MTTTTTTTTTNYINNKNNNNDNCNNTTTKKCSYDEKCSKLTVRYPLVVDEVNEASCLCVSVFGGSDELLFCAFQPACWPPTQGSKRGRSQVKLKPARSSRGRSVELAVLTSSNEDGRCVWGGGGRVPERTRTEKTHLTEWRRGRNPILFAVNTTVGD